MRTFLLCLLVIFPFSLWGTNKEEALEDILTKYHREVTVLDIGETPEESICHFAQRYPGSVFIIMGKEKMNFVKKLQKNDLCKNIIWLNHFPTFQSLQTLSLSEHFDIIILNHHNDMSPEELDKMAIVCQQMAQHVIVNSSEGISRYVLENHAPFSLINRTCVHPRTITRLFTLFFDYDQIFLIKVKPPYEDLKCNWSPGINLITYLVYNGYYPPRLAIVLNLPIDFEHRDWMPNNMILQGKNIHLIDRDDPTNEYSQSGCLQLIPTIRLIMHSRDLPMEAVKQLFCRIYKVEHLLEIEETD